MTAGPVVARWLIPAEPGEIGKALDVGLLVEGASASQVQFPVIAGGDFGDFVVVEVGPAQERDGGVVKPLRILPVRSGEVSLPTLTFPVRRGGDAEVVTCSEQPLLVASALATTEEPSLRDELALEAFAGGLSGWIVSAIVLASALAALWLAATRRRAPPAERARGGRDVRGISVARPAEEVALDRLAALRGSEIGDDAVATATLLELADVVRRYLEASLPAPILPRTTEEVRSVVTGRTPSSLADEFAAWTEMLHRADLAKYAACPPDGPQVAAGVERVAVWLERRRAERAGGAL